MRRAEKLCRSNEGKDSDYFIDYGGGDSLEKGIIPKKYFMGLTKLQLGSKEYNAPIEYKKVLEHIYGASWMEPPPNKLKYRHGSLYEKMSKFVIRLDDVAELMYNIGHAGEVSGEYLIS